jgi:hypothetical protein
MLQETVTAVTTPETSAVARISQIGKPNVGVKTVGSVGSDVGASISD